MKLLRAYYRWNLDILDGIKTALRRWPAAGVAVLALAPLALSLLGAPSWLVVAEGGCCGVAIYFVLTEAR